MKYELDIIDLMAAPSVELNRLHESIKLAKTITGFTEKMAEKVARHIDNREGWDDEEYASGMYDALEEALAEGDYVSVANYAMFLNGLGYKPGRIG